MINKFTSKLICLFMALMVLSCSADQQPTIQALLITGGGWHDYEMQKSLLTEGIREILEDNIEWTIVYEGDGEPDYHISIMQEENWTDGYDVVVHNYGFGRVTDSDFVEHFVEHHKGTPAVIIHAAILSYRYAEPADPWFKFMGLQSMGHENQRSFGVENLAPDHPIMRDIPETWHTPMDEVYIVEKIWEDITPLSRAYGEQTEAYHTVAWTHEFGDTRVFATTLGHNNEMFEREEFLVMVTNGLLWAVERL